MQQGQGRAASPLRRFAGRTPFLRSLRFRVLLVAVAVLVAPLLFAFAWGRSEQNLEMSLRANVRDAAQEAVDALLDFGDDDPDSHRKGTDAGQLSVQGKLETIAARRAVRIRLVALDGTVLADVDRERQTDLIHRLSIMLFGDDGVPTLQQFDESLGPVEHRPEAVRGGKNEPSEGCRTSVGSKLLLCHSVRWIPRGSEASKIIYVQETSRRAVRAVYDLRYQIFRLTVLLLPIALGVAAWFGARVVRPLEALRREALRKASNARPEGKLSARGPEEVGDVAEAFNTLLTKLYERERGNERFVADLVHEFKSPVAAIRACAEALASGHVDDKRAARLSRILADSSTRLDALVSQFLELARAEAGMVGESRSVVDLRELAHGVVETLRLRHPTVCFEVQGEEPCPVEGVEVRLESVLRNLIDNAAVFAAGKREEGPQGEVVVQIRGVEREVVVRVLDNGPGIAAEDVPRVFERFFTTRGRGQGSGLGLPLARAIAEAHGGTLSALAAVAQGAAFELRLPRHFPPDSPSKGIGDWQAEER